MVAEALAKTAPLLRHLDLSGNELTAEGGAAVAACAATKASLEYLGLEDNEIGTAGAKAVCTLMRDALLLLLLMCPRALVGWCFVL